MPGTKGRATISAVFGLLLVAYISVYTILSLGGRYEPSGLGLGGVKFHEWAPRGFHSDLTWRKKPMVFFLPLHVLDRWLWHDQDAIDSGRYPVTEVDPKDIWRYYEAEGLLEESQGHEGSIPALRNSPQALEDDNRNQADVSRALESATERVSGIVTLDGQPLGNATVKFLPVDGGQPISGRTNAQGQYELEMGVAPGNYGVKVVDEESATKGTGKKELKGDIGKRPGGGNSDADSGR